jgi:NAD(P)-dependent dehydrogenase (short-subunit alcohol dehydrogenase family)
MPIRNFTSRKCFITGAASGIGRATARAAAGEGAILFLTDLHGESLSKVAREIAEAGGQVAAHAALDVADHEAVQAFAREIHAKHGPMDVVMNVAGIAVWGTVQDLRHQHWKKAVDVNLMGPIHVIEAFVPAMVEGGNGGHLVNVSSAAGLLGLPWHAAYSAAKFGLRGISEVLRFDLERHGIGVSLVCPGAVDTGLVDTIEVLGIDLENPAARRMKEDFRRHAISPEKAAQAILDGIHRNRYLVFTSFDIRAAHWLQRYLPFAYEQVMRRLGARMARVAAQAAVKSAPPPA